VHLAEILVHELADLQVHQHETAKEPVVEHQVDIEVIAFEGQALLPRDEAEALAQLQKEILEPLDDRSLEIGFEPRGLLLKAEKLEDQRILHDIGRCLDARPLRARARTPFLSRLFARRSKSGEEICRSSSRVDQFSRVASIS
jgi:hypothetical protein